MAEPLAIVLRFVPRASPSQAASDRTARDAADRLQADAARVARLEVELLLQVERVCNNQGMSERSRLVYSTDRGRICPTCGWPERDCKCSSQRATGSIPDRIVAKLRLEKQGRGGKAVTVVYDLPNNERFLKELCQELKRACGTGGTVAENTVELQGDLRDRVRELLTKKGYTVKG